MRPEAEKEMTTNQTTPADVVIEARGLSKSYGSLQALRNVSFTVRKGEILAYLGPNGAGKTTTINILCGLLDRDGGQAQVCGLDIAEDPVGVKQQIGVVPEESNLYPELSCRRNLEYLGELYGLPRTARKEKAESLLTLFDITDKATSPFRALSRGLKRRLTVAAALIHSPQVVFLDEPTAGLDVPSARSLRSLIRTINRDGATVFLTTHNLAEAESLSHRILILVRGQLAAEGTAAEIRKQVERTRSLSVTFSADVLERMLRDACPDVRSISLVEGAWRLEVTDVHRAAAQLLSFADENGLRILELNTSTPSLEDAFMTILESDSGREEAPP